MFITYIGFAQRDKAAVMTQVNEFTAKLDQQGIDRYFTTTRYCIGSVEMFRMPDGTRCASQGTYYEVYVVWQERNGTTQLKKVDNCGMFDTISLSDASVFDFFTANVNTLQDEEVKPYQVANPQNSPTLRTEVHPCRRQFSFTDDRNTISKEYRLYDLTNASEQRNLNYNHNTSLKLVTLDQMMDSVLSQHSTSFRRMQL
ncbi:MAG: hypothetical protein CMC08_08695 [Flavobacteriaceae bacterium]|nr:hypothetical protein [Flavobacteriaceae bacterium]